MRVSPIVGAVLEATRTDDKTTKATLVVETANAEPLWLQTPASALWGVQFVISVGLITREAGKAETFNLARDDAHQIVVRTILQQRRYDSVLKVRHISTSCAWKRRQHEQVQKKRIRRQQSPSIFPDCCN